MRRTAILLALTATLTTSLVLGISISPVNAATCVPSPLCPSSSACDADCKSRGARFGVCTAEQCCVCF